MIWKNDKIYYFRIILNNLTDFMKIYKLSLFLFFAGLFISNSQDITISAEKESFQESQSNKLIANLSSASDSDIKIYFQLLGTAKESSDYNLSFKNKDSINITGGSSGGSLSQFNEPIDVFVKNDTIYVADLKNHRIVRWDPGASEGVLVAGGNSEGSNLNQLYLPISVHVTPNGDIYVADQSNHRIVKWEAGASEGIIVAGGNGDGQGLNQLQYPRSIVVDSDNNIFVSDNGNHRVVKWTPGATEGVVVAGKAEGNPGDGLAFLAHPHGIDLESDGSVIIADNNNSRVVRWKKDATEGELVGIYSNPTSIAVDHNDNIYISEQYNNRVIKVPAGSTSSTFNGSVVAGGYGGGSNKNQFNQASGVHVDEVGDLFIADKNNNRVKKYSLAPQILISAGETSGEITVTGIPDVVDEDDKTIIFKPISSSSGSLADGNITMTLLDNDDPSSISFESNKKYLQENLDDTITITVKLDKVSDKTISIPFTTSGTATIQDEYIITASPLVINSGSSSGSIVISNSGLNDSTVEVVETIQVDFGTVENATNNTSSLTYSLISDDHPTLNSISISL